MAEIMTAREAVEKYIHTGMQVCWGGFSYTRRPYTIAREVIRQRDRIKHHFCTMNGGASIEEALAANDLISKLETTYVGLEGIQPVANSIRRRVQDGSIPLFEDYSNYGYATRTIAGRFGWPFAPLMAELGSDVPIHDVFGKAGLRGRNDDGSWIDPRIPPKKLAFIDDPFDGWGLRPHAFEGGDTTANKTNAVDRVRQSDKYTGQKGVKVILVPPLLPEVTVIRAQRVAQDGTVRMEGINGPDAEQAMCAKVLIVECEQIVPSDELRAAPELNHLPAHQTTVIVEQPYGGYPSAVPNYYDYDWDWWVSYGRLNRKSKEEVRDWWTKHVVETEDDWDYLQRIVGMKRLFELRATPAYGYRADLKRPM